MMSLMMSLANGKRVVRLTDIHRQICPLHHIKLRSRKRILILPTLALFSLEQRSMILLMAAATMMRFLEIRVLIIYSAMQETMSFLVVEDTKARM
ncbi:MAG: hypothetical protein CFE32_14895, partial [Alphaproteobacteria bacterium PA3]